jgi:two-component system, NtrC family, sensor kinase
VGLKLRLILILTIPAVLAVGVHGVLRIRQERDQLIEEDRQNMTLTAAAIQIAVENALRDRQFSDVKRLLAELAERQTAIDRIRLFNRQLEPTLVSSQLSIGEDVPIEILRRVVESKSPESFYRRQGQHSIHYYIVPVRDGQGQIAGTLEIVRLVSGIDARMHAAANDVWIRLGILLAVIVVLTAIALQRQVVRPISGLMEGIQRLGRGEPAAPLPVGRRDEIGRVAEAFNEMTAQLDAARRRLLAETEHSLDLEQQLRAAETLAVAGKLASSLAHEVGTPLNIVSGRAEFLQMSPSLDEAARRDLGIIVGQIDRISKIIRSLLDSVRPQKLELQPTSLGDVLDSMLPLLNHPARRRGVAIVTSVPPDLPMLRADPGQLQQVLINLVLNGVDATPASGHITISAEAADEGSRPGVAIAVHDTGPGIPVEIQAKVFEPFFTTKAAGRGTGLGLAICRDIIKGHGGHITVESTPESGTTFTMWVPTTEAV